MEKKFKKCTDWKWLEDYDKYCRHLCYKMYVYTNGETFNPMYLGNDRDFRKICSKVDANYKAWVKSRGNGGHWGIFSHPDRMKKMLNRMKKMDLLTIDIGDEGWPTGDYNFADIPAIKAVRKELFLDEL